MEWCEVPKRANEVLENYILGSLERMKKLLIVGAGEYGQLVRELAFDCGYQKVEFLDDNSSLAVGKVNDYTLFKDEYSEFIVAIGNPASRRNAVSKLEKDFKLVSLIHPRAYISYTAEIGSGSIVEACSAINTGAVLGKCSFVNAGAIVNHNSSVGEYSQIDCNAVVAARAEVPPETKVFSCTVWNRKFEMPVGDGTFLDFNNNSN